MTLFTLPSCARLCGPQGVWIYLGKNVAGRLEVEKHLGRAPLSLGGLLREEALRLKQPFLDLVAELGRGREDQAAWWAGTLPWKAWSSSDLFLLCCYQSLAKRLAGPSSPFGTAELSVVIEDPWLFCQLRESLKGHGFEGNPSLATWRIKALTLGMARRAKWLARMVLSRLLQRWHSRGRFPKLPREGGVAVYSHLMQHSLEGSGGWNDRYFPGLDRELEARETPVMRCTYPDQTGWEKELARRHEIAAPLILYSSWSGLIRSLAALPPDTPASAEIEGVPIGMLLRREWWHDLSRAGRCAYLLLLDCARRFLGAADWKSVVFPWENQPQERMLILAAREKGVKTVGYQHTTVPLLQMPFFAGKGECDWAPLPDVILASGPYPMDLLSANGVSQDRIKLAGSRRYAHLLNGKNQSNVRTLPSGSEDVLVILPIDRHQTQHLLAALARAYPRGGQGFDFLIKPHPTEPLRPGDIPFPARCTEGPLDESLRRCGAVVFSGTSSGLEALLAGRPVLRYRPETLIDVDPCELLEESQLATAGDSDLREKLEALPRNPPRDPSAAATLERFFSPVNPDVWREALG